MVRLRATRTGGAGLMYGLACGAPVRRRVRDLPQSALLAPISVVAAIAYFRRRELLKLSPLALDDP